MGDLEWDLMIFQALSTFHMSLEQFWRLFWWQWVMLVEGSVAHSNL